MDNLHAIQRRLERLEDLARERLPEGDTYVSIELIVNWSPLYPIKLRVSTDIPLPEGFEPGLTSLDELNDRIEVLEAHLRALPGRDALQKQKAVENLGRALDECRDAGIDTAPFAKPFANIYDNLLEAQ